MDSFTRDRLTWLNYLMMAYYSFLLNSLGPITPFLKSELNLSYTVSSYHFSAFALGLTLVGLLGDRISQRLGRQRVFWGGGMGAAVGVVMLVTGQNPAVTITGTFLMGFAGSLTFFLIQSSLTMHHPLFRLKVITEANVIASLFGMTAPLGISVFENTGLSWRTVFYLLVAWYAVLFVTSRRVPLPVSEERTSSKQRGSLPFIFWLMWLRLFLVIAIEFCVLFWGANFLEQTHGFVNADAAALMSLVLIGMVAGRAMGSRLSERMEAKILFAASLTFVVVGFLIYAFIQSFVMIGLLLTGFGIANLYPIGFAQSLQAVSVNQDTASARLAIASGLSILLMPLVLGWFADQVGIGQAYLTSIGALIISAFILHFVLVIRIGKVS